MYFDSFSDLLYMAGHGVYVWPSFAITLISLLVLIIYPLRKKRKLLNAIKQRSLFEQESVKNESKT